MKTNKYLKSGLKIFLAACLWLALMVDLKAQNESDDLNEFAISIEKRNNEIVMKCSDGCAWTSLTYNNRAEFQAINEFGMTSINNNEPANASASPKLLFTITKTEDGVSLKGIQGTAWTDLSFTLKNYQVQEIDQFGMSEGR